MIKRISMMLLILLLGSCIVCFSSKVDAVQAQEQKNVIRYYTSIEIQNGDTLWSIAERYSKHSGLSVSEYVKELKHMNGLKEDMIHTGCYLTIVYFVLE